MWPENLLFPVYYKSFPKMTFGQESCSLSMSSLKNHRHRIRYKNEQIKNHLFVWRTVSLGLSLFALILIASRLCSICKEVKFLQFVLNEWLPKQNLTQNSKPTPQVIHVENLRQDIDILIIELWYSRTTLILGVVFVFAYILSWGWMTYVMQETAKNSGAMSSSDFPRDMRQLSIMREHDQLAAFVSLRLSVLQSSSGTTDIFISGLVAFLTAIRVYIVICAVSFYNRIRKEPPGSTSSSYPLPKFKSLPEDAETQSVKTGDDLLKPNGNYMSWSAGKTGETNKETFHKDIIGNSTRKYSSTTSVTEAGEDEVTPDDFKIQAADMPIHMQRAALHGAIQACRLYTTEKHIAESIKQDFDQMFEPTWHCIVGRNWGSCVTHSKQCYIRILYKDLTILLYKST